MSRRHGGEESRQVPRQRVTVTVQELVDDPTAGACSSAQRGHLGEVPLRPYISFSWLSRMLRRHGGEELRQVPRQ